MLMSKLFWKRFSSAAGLFWTCLSSLGCWWPIVQVPETHLGFPSAASVWASLRCWMVLARLFWSGGHFSCSPCHAKALVFRFYTFRSFGTSSFSVFLSPLLPLYFRFNHFSKIVNMGYLKRNKKSGKELFPLILCNIISLADF